MIYILVYYQKEVILIHWKAHIPRPQSSLYPGIDGRRSLVPEARINFRPNQVSPLLFVTSNTVAVSWVTRRAPRICVSTKVKESYLQTISSIAVARKSSGLFPSLQSTLCIIGAASFLYSCESNRMAERHALPRAIAAASPAGPPPNNKGVR